MMLNVLALQQYTDSVDVEAAKLSSLISNICCNGIIKETAPVGTGR